jgi:hypothetical protein
MITAMDAGTTCNGYATRSFAPRSDESGEWRIAVENPQCNLHCAPLNKLQLA